jgi:hypothetical protein
VNLNSFIKDKGYVIDSKWESGLGFIGLVIIGNLGFLNNLAGVLVFLKSTAREI